MIDYMTPAENMALISKLPPMPILERLGLTKEEARRNVLKLSGGQQQALWMDFIREDKTYTKYYDEFVVLLETGMRVSEFCGLTKSDLDFENRIIHVDH